MASLDMTGPFNFTSDQIDKTVTRTSAGNYALGYVNKKGTFIVQYVGRSDTGLSDELKKRLNPKYMKFKYSYVPSATAGYRKECYNYHDFGGSEKLHNKKHPDRPGGTDLKCPVCGE